MKSLQTIRLFQFVSLAGLLFGLVATGCDGILGIEGFEAGCLDGAKRCSDNTPQTCGADGQWHDEGTCAIGLCQDGYCIPQCVPDAKGCDKNIPRECNQSRIWEPKEACEIACLGGSCVMTCKSNDPPTCIGNAPATCNEQGQWQTSSACVEQTCVNGACQGECTYQTKRCLGTTVQTCDASGQWQSTNACETNEICVAGTCGCVPGDRRCFENAPQLCYASNQWENDGARCENQACDPATLECIGECAPGQRRCMNGNTLQECDSKGEWQPGQTCALGCFDGICTECMTGETRCTGNTPQTCASNGQWIDEPECINQTCIAGTCQGQCASGAKRCSANYPQVCNASGFWENNGPACAACVECEAMTKTCGTDPISNDSCPQPTTITTGRFHTCALLPDQTLKCWGYNAAGQLGLGDGHDRGTKPGQMGANLPKIDLGAGLLVQDISAGTTHTCARFSNGSIKCWGNNAFGQLGLGDGEHRGDDSDEMGTFLSQVNLGGFSAIAMTTGETHSCAILSDGKVKCWGGNFYGQLGLGDTLARGDQPGEMGANLSSIDFGNGATAALISAGDMHTCARLSSIVVKCWGNNSFGQLGLGDTNHRGDQIGEMGMNLPVIDLDLPAGIIVKDISAGGTHTCALLSDGLIKCWGKNDFGQLGLGNTNNRGDEPDEMGVHLAPVDLGLGLGITVLGISAGSAHTCALLSNGTVKCWGKNDVGQLGLGDKNARGDEPGEMGVSLSIVNLGAGVIATEIHAGHSHTCALLSSGRVKCWGRSVYGQLGQSDTVTRGDESKDMGDALLPVDL